MVRNTVSVAPNLATLSEVLNRSRQARVNSGRYLVCAVDKAGERVEYGKRSHHTADWLVGLFGADRTIELRNYEATKEKCLEKLQLADHAVFISHGAETGQLHGRGI